MVRSNLVSRSFWLAAALTLFGVLYAPETRAQSCTTSGPNLCLTGNRFRVSVQWQSPYDPTQGGAGTAVNLTSDTGYFWFFNSANIELVIKILDARGVDGHFWYFSGALTDTEYTVTVTDTTTGVQKQYYNPPKTLQSRIDQRIF